MGKFLAGTRYLALIGVLALLAAALAAFGWGIAKTVEAVTLVITSLGRDPVIIIALIEIVDAFLVAMALLLFSVRIYELFIGELELPDWMKIHDLHDLKAKLRQRSGAGHGGQIPGETGRVEECPGNAASSPWPLPCFGRADRLQRLPAKRNEP